MLNFKGCYGSLTLMENMVHSVQMDNTIRFNRRIGTGWYMDTKTFYPMLSQFCVTTVTVSYNDS